MASTETESLGSQLTPKSNGATTTPQPKKSTKSNQVMSLFSRKNLTI